jgi:hypothetical protein
LVGVDAGVPVFAGLTVGVVFILMFAMFWPQGQHGFHLISQASDLNLEITPAKYQVLSSGEWQTYSVKVTDNFGNVIPGVFLKAVVGDTMGNQMHFSGVSDELGKWSFSYQIPDNSKFGNFSVAVYSSKTGYRTSIATVGFPVA